MSTGPSLQKLLERRKEQESTDLRTVLGELSRQIQAFLKEGDNEEASGQLKLDLWREEERSQRERDHEALRRRLEEIPGELERELLALEQRYREPEAKLFPMAVTWVVPEGVL